jgi:hypothetical protein
MMVISNVLLHLGLGQRTYTDSEEAITHGSRRTSLESLKATPWRIALIERDVISKPPTRQIAHNVILPNVDVYANINIISNPVHELPLNIHRLIDSLAIVRLPFCRDVSVPA